MKRTLFCLTAVAALGMFAADVNRKRDIIFYHTDNLPVFWPKSIPYTPEALVHGFDKNRLMDGLSAQAMKAAIQPDTFVYVPMGNFANLSVHVPSNEPQMEQPVGSSWLAGVRNTLPDIKKAGKAQDPISVMSDFVRKENKKEFFVCLCVNENFMQYDYNPLKPPPPWLAGNYMFNPFKAKHLDWLMGSQKDTPPLKGLKDNFPPYASWNMVDYGQMEVRSKFVAIASEIIAGYEIDGIMIDFCRSPSLFRSVAWGGTASAAQLQLITDMMGQISVAAKQKGVLVAVRVPDSQQACKNAGMDVQTWFERKFVDLLFIGNTEMNRWSESTEFAKKCGVPFYATIENSRIYSLNDEAHTEDDQRMPRECQEVYRARVSEARLAGAKGIMYTSGRTDFWDFWWNYIPPKFFQPAQEKIRLENKRYFVNYRAGYRHFIKDFHSHAPSQRQLLNASSPREIKGTAKYEIYVWDNMEKLKAEGVKTKCYLTTIAEVPSGWSIDVTLNSKPIKLIKKRAGSQIYAIPSGLLTFGKNDVLLSVKGSNKRGLVPRIGNIGIDVIFNGELDALKKPGNVPGALSTAAGGADASAKKGAKAPASGGKAGKSARKGGRK